MNTKTPVPLYVDIGHLKMSIHQWGVQKENDTSVVLIHATGFHGRCWDEVVNQLHHHHIIAIDLRGHGASDNLDFVSWEDFGKDIAATLRKLGLKRVILVGHSLGGVASVIAAHLEPNIVEKVLLIDPVILPPVVYQNAGLDMSIVGKASRARQAEFASVDAMIERYSAREPFQRFTKETFKNYCQHGLHLNQETGKYHLACPPEFESKVYTHMASYQDIYNTLEGLEQRVHLLRAMQPPGFDKFYGFAYSPTYPGLIQHIKNGVDLELATHSHFIPQEDPALTAKQIKALIEHN